MGEERNVLSDDKSIHNQIEKLEINTQKGQGEKGSKRLIQCFVDNKQEELNELILMSSPSLVSFIDQKLSIEWKSPLSENDFREYRNEFLDFEEEWKGKRAKLERYWAKRGPQWDGIAVVEGDNGKKGLLLIEAKAHVHEMRSKIKATDTRSKEVIERSLMEVKQAIGSQVSLDIWLNRYYQLANRLTYLHVLNKKLDIPTWLVLVNFVDDKSLKETNSLQWIKHYQEVYKEMGISADATNLFDRVVTVFPNSLCMFQGQNQFQ